jgi:hypothetical protein
MTKEKFDKVETRDPSDQGALSDRQWVILRYADDMTTKIAAYNCCVSRFLVSLDVNEIH